MSDSLRPVDSLGGSLIEMSSMVSNVSIDNLTDIRLCAPFILFPQLGYRSANTSGCTNTTVLSAGQTCNVECASGYEDFPDSAHPDVGVVECMESSFNSNSTLPPYPANPMRISGAESFVCVNSTHLDEAEEAGRMILQGLAAIILLYGLFTLAPVFLSSSSGGSSSHSAKQNGKQNIGSKNLEEDSDNDNDDVDKSSDHADTKSVQIKNNRLEESDSEESDSNDEDEASDAGKDTSTEERDEVENGSEGGAETKTTITTTITSTSSGKGDSGKSGEKDEGKDDSAESGDEKEQDEEDLEEGSDGDMEEDRDSDLDGASV